MQIDQKNGDVVLTLDNGFQVRVQKHGSISVASPRDVSTGSPGETVWEPPRETVSITIDVSLSNLDEAGWRDAVLRAVEYEARKLAKGSKKVDPLPVDDSGTPNPNPAPKSADKPQ